MTTPLIYGWDSPQSVAEDIWSSIHSTLLKGNLVFAYRGQKGQIVLVKNTESDFAVGVMREQGYTMLLPHVPKEYVSGEDLLEELSDLKISKKIIEEFKKIKL